MVRVVSEEETNTAVEILQDTPLGKDVPITSRQTRSDPRVVRVPSVSPKQAQPTARPALYRAPRFISPSTGVCYEHDVVYNTPKSGVSYAPTRLSDLLERGEKRKRDFEGALESTNKYARITQFKKWLEDQGEGFLEDIAAGLGEPLARTRIVTALLFLQGVLDV